MSIFDYLLLFISLITLLMGLIGSIIPVIPGPILAYISIIILISSIDQSLPFNTLMIWGVVVFFFSIIENFIQFYGVKLFGGRKLAIIGSTIGFLIGLFIPLIGFIIGTFFGAFIGAFIEYNNNTKKALKIAFGSFIGFFGSVILKLIISFYFVYEYCKIFLGFLTAN